MVWVGKDDNTPMGLTGSSGALRVWSQLIHPIAHRSYTPSITSDIDFHVIDNETGWLAEMACENAIQLPFIKGSAPQQISPCVTSGLIKTNETEWLDDDVDDYD